MTATDVTHSETFPVPVNKLLSYCDPMKDDVWGCGVITVEDVECCEDINIGRLPSGATAEDAGSWEYNVARIAWLCQKGWKAADSDMEPVTVHVGQDGATRTRVEVRDGNHRLAAACVNRDSIIRVVAEGETSEVERFLLN